MVFKCEILEKVNINNTDDAREYCKEEFKKNIKEIDEKSLLGLLFLIFENHQEVYYLDERYFSSPLKNINKTLQEFADDIECKTLKGMFYFMKDEYYSTYSLGFSHINLNYYLCGTINKNLELKLAEKNFDFPRIIGKPEEITKALEQQRGSRFSKAIVESFYDLIDAKSDEIREKLPFTTNELKDFTIFVLSPNDIKNVFELDVKNNYYFLIRYTGDITVCSPISTVKPYIDEEFYNEIMQNAKALQIQENIASFESLLSLCFFLIDTDYKIIEIFKLVDGKIKCKQFKDARNFIKLNLKSRVSSIETLCNKLCINHERN